MDNKQSKAGSNRPAAAVKEIGLVLQPGGSKKLAEIRRKAQTNEPPVEATDTDHEIPADLKADVAAELKKARKLINEKITDIMSRFPVGKQNKLFGFRYGSVDAIKRMAIGDAFRRLGIAHNQVRMKLIAGLDYYGKVSGAEETRQNPSTAE